MTYALQAANAYKTFFEDDEEQQRPWWRVWERKPRRYLGWEVVWLMCGTVSVLTFGLIGADDGFIVLAVASVSFLGLGLVAAVLPLLLCSSVYYQVTVLPGWLQPLAKLNPATHALTPSGPPGSAGRGWLKYGPR